MLSPTDIRPAVEAVLRSTDNALSSFQILDRLPVGLRDLIIVERGWPGAGSGNSYSAASLVTDAVEGLLPSMEPPYRTYIDTGNTTFQVAGKTIAAGNMAIAFYRLPNQGASSLGRSDLQTPGSLSRNADRADVVPLQIAPKLQWFEKPGVLALWAIVFWPIFLLGMYYNGKAAIAANRTPWYEKTELLIVSVLFFPLLFMGIFSSRKISGRGKLIAASILATMVVVPQIQIGQEGRRIREVEAHQAQDAAVAQAQQAEKDKVDAQAFSRFQATPKGKAQLAAERARKDAENKREAAAEKRSAIARKQHDEREAQAERATAAAQAAYENNIALSSDGLVLTRNYSARRTEVGTTISGTIVNETDQTFRYAQVEFAITDSSGNTVRDTVMTNTTYIAPHGKWKFEIPVFTSGAWSYKPIRIESTLE